MDLGHQNYEQNVMEQDYKKHLLDILYVRSFKYDPDKGFTLSSGAKSDVYIDVKKTALSAEGMQLVGYACYQEIKLAPVDGIGGLTLGADPIAYATAMVSTQYGKPIDVFVVRKEPKGHGTGQWIEGNLNPGANVVIIEDVLTTGNSAIQAVKRAREAGYNVVGVLALVDREEGGADNLLKECNCKVKSVFTKSDLMEAHEKAEEEKETEKANESKKARQAEKPVF
ncbi:MAG: orotate phosphoribosyltransferase [Thermodesulfobacteriota bacterium]